MNVNGIAFKLSMHYDETVHENDDSDEYFTVFFDAGKGEVSEKERIIHKNSCSAQEFPTAISNDGYEFKCWVDGNGVECNNLNLTSNNDITLFAVYEETSITETWEITETAKFYDSPLSINVTNESEPLKTNFIIGDANHDGIIDGRDASAVFTKFTQISTSDESSLTQEELLVIDVNQSGRLDLEDASIILSYYTITSANNYDISFVEYLKAPQ